MSKTTKTRLTFLAFSDAEPFLPPECKDGWLEKDFDTKQEAFEYMCYYAEYIDYARIQVHETCIVDCYDCESGFLYELVNVSQNIKTL